MIALVRKRRIGRCNERAQANWRVVAPRNQKKMTRKKRTPPPEAVASEVMFASDFTCCVCREPGKAVQIHHINSVPTDHRAENLCVLCMEDHHRTLIRGGFGRALKATDVVVHRDDWLRRVALRRAEADRIAAQLMTPAAPNDAPLTTAEYSAPPVAFIRALPSTRKAALAASNAFPDRWTTAGFRGAQGEYRVVLEGMFLALSNYYPPNHFGGMPARRYFAEYIRSRFEWHYAHIEPQGSGSRGTMVLVIVAAMVTKDIERMVEELVSSLLWADSPYSFKEWKQEWDSADVITRT